MHVHMRAYTHTSEQGLDERRKKKRIVTSACVLHPLQFPCLLWGSRVLTQLEVSLAQMLFTQPLNCVKLLDVEHDFNY